VPLPSSSNRTKLLGPTLFRIPVTCRMCPENVDKLCCSDWLSPRSASTSEKIATYSSNKLVTAFLLLHLPTTTRVVSDAMALRVGIWCSGVLNKLAKHIWNAVTSSSCKQTCTKYTTQGIAVQHSHPRFASPSRYLI
jgi:hypothetical protein